MSQQSHPERLKAEKQAPKEAKSYIMHPNAVATQWVKGQSGNPNLFGMSNRDASQGRLNAKSALRVRAMLLSTLESTIATQMSILHDPEATDEEREEAQKKILKFISADVNTMLRDAETRGLGAPKQEIKLTQETKSVEDMTDEELEGLILEGEYTEIEDD